MGILFSLFLLWTCVRRDLPLVRFFMWRPLRMLGSLSYGIYMWHVISSACLAVALETWAPHSFANSSPWARLIGAILSALAFATVSRFAIEKPFLRLKARFRQSPAY